MSIYEKNLTAIKEKDPELYQAIREKTLDQEGIEFYIDSAKSGELVLCAKQDGKVQFMNSRYDPEREAERFVLQYDKVLDYSFMTFFGLGNGQIANKIVQSLGEHVTYLFYEPSPHLFLLVLEQFDITALIECDRVKIIVYGMNDDHLDANISFRITYENYKICIYDVLPRYRQLFAMQEEAIRSKYDFHVKVKAANIATYIEFDKTLTYNDIYNMRNLFYCNCEEEFEGVFPTDRPAIIVAAGPSLEKNVQYLKEAKGYFLMIAVDTALPYLVSQNIRPDLVLVVDPEKPPQLLEGVNALKIPIAVATDVNYEILESIEHKVIYICSESGCYNKIFQLQGRTMYRLPGGGSVATNAFALAITWGYQKVILVGQDLALAPHKVHVGDIDVGLSRLNEGRIEIEGYYGDKVYTLPDYNHYREWYEAVIRGDAELEVINATEGGAKIHGTIQMPLKEALDTYKVDFFDFEKTIREMPPTFSADQRDDIIQMWKSSVRNLETLKHKLYEGIEQAAQGVERMQSKQYSQSQIAGIQEKLDRIIGECDAMEEIYYLNGMVLEEEADVLGDIYFAKEDADEEVCRVFEKMLKYMKAMYSSIDEVKAMFEKIIVDAQGKHLNG